MKFNEKEALLQIKDGKTLKEFKKEDYDWEQEPTHWPTRLMVLAALTYQKEMSYTEIPENEWTQRAAKMAVTSDYKAILFVPDQLKQHCVIPFANHYLKQDRLSMPEYKKVFRQQTEIFQISCISFNPGISDDRDDMMRRYNKKILKQPVMIPKKETGNYELDFTGDEEFSSKDELTPYSFLSLPVTMQTEEKLMKLVDSDLDFPGDFIKKLLIPRRNAMFYANEGDIETSEYWKKKIIPYLNKEICETIAEKHPEGALATTPYLQKESVKKFWERKKEICSAKEMTEWFLKFPAEMLDEDMRKDIVVNRMVLKHAPEIMKGSDEAKRHLLRNPNDVLYLPEYQTPGFLLLDGVKLDKQTVEMISNESFREKVKIALNIA